MWLINITISLSSFATKAIELPSVKDLRNFCTRRAKFLKEEMKQHLLKSKVPAIGRLLSLRANLCAP